MRTRFAPSPTGRLHLGHAFAARVAHDAAREAGGEFFLRFEDIDHTRVREPFYVAIEEDLRWLGLEWDGIPWRQLDRLKDYDAALSQLKKKGVLYPCTCTRREISAAMAELGAPHGKPHKDYPGTCRHRLGENPDGPVAWRLHAERAAELVGKLTFTDLRFGPIEVDPLVHGDVVLARKDIATSYHLAVTVDDAAQKVTRVTRGEDLLSSTHIHRVLQALLGLPEPEYEHHRLIVDEDGKRLATRDKARTIKELRGKGWSVVEVWEAVGWVDPV